MIVFCAGRHSHDRWGGGRCLTSQGLKIPRLSGEHGRARLVVMGTEVGGRWSPEEMRHPPLEAVFVRPGSASGKACRGALQSKRFAQSLLDGPASGGVDGPTASTHAVLGDARFG